jgi:glycosyltransferase involved in cell wall biosynthesis
MAKVKNFDKTIEAFRRTLAARPDARLLLIGDGPERGRLENMVDAYGLRSQVALAGYRRDVFSFLKSCHLLVMPSDYEGFGIAHLEAMACRLPAVISHYVPSKELAAGCALLCDTTPESIAANMLRLLNDAELYTSCAQKALQVSAALTVDRHCDSLLQVYELLLARAPIDRVQY